jgi:hypothetical protein
MLDYVKHCTILLLHVLVPWRQRSTTTSFQVLLSKALFSRFFQVVLVLLISDSISRVKYFWVGLSFFYLEDSRTKPVWLCSHWVFSVYGLAISTFYISDLVLPIIVSVTILCLHCKGKHKVLLIIHNIVFFFFSLLCCAAMCFTTIKYNS